MRCAQGEPLTPPLSPRPRGEGDRSPAPPRPTAPLAVRLDLHQDDPNRMVGPDVRLVRGAELHHDVVEDARMPRRRRYRPFLR